MTRLGTLALCLIAGSALAADAPGPCSAPTEQQLAFWLGDWDLVIRAPKGPNSTEWVEAPGNNHVRQTLGGCVVEENFSGVGPGQPWAGKSVSTFMPTTQEWRQTWVDDQGGYLAFRGGWTPTHEFVLYGEPKETKGKPTTQMRMVFRHIEKDHFDWSWERGTPGGAQWQPVMTIAYRRSADGACDSHELDFWVGSWKVMEKGKQVGTNRIEKVLGGCAVMEHWTEATGEQGQSLFYHPAGSSHWKQIWLTDHARLPGGTKEKEEIWKGADGSLRFQGSIELPDGRRLLDRTTLSPLPAGRVRQVIETSREGGSTWQIGFDAVYEPLR